MKKFIIAAACVIVLYFCWDYAYYKLGWYIDLQPGKEVSVQMTVERDKIYMSDGGKRKEFVIKGVNMGSGQPGEWATDYAIKKETYLRWFAEIKEMGANTLRVYTILSDDFYNAFYEYNKNNPDPLYLIHGVWVNDYVQNSHRDAYDKDFCDTLIADCRTVVDILHGNRKVELGRGTGSGFYRKDVSEWVIGYIIGVEWEDVTVVYTNEKYPERSGFQGEYMYTTKDATPFEAMLAQVGDKMIEYESKRYKQQKLVAFSNWPTTDPFDYQEDVARFFMKCAKVDVEHIRTTEKFRAGQFASYHVYPYYPDYLTYVNDWTQYGIGNREDFYNEKGELNTYRAYLNMLTNHHTMPVVISEFGVSTGRGMAQRDANTGRNQGNMAEHEQGAALISCFEDILSAGCAGGAVFSWQDEWFKRTWNTMYAVDLKRTPYWSDYQTNEQYFGLLSFDPGKEKSVCYVDGNVSEWNEKDVVCQNGNLSLSMKYDEKFVYFLVHKPGLDFENETLYIPIDTTPKSGSNYCENYDIKFERQADFLITIHGKTDSRIQVQERYEALRSNYYHETHDKDAYEFPPDIDSPKFMDINMILQTATVLMQKNAAATAEVFETGLLTYGNANPKAAGFNSLADFICKGDYVELKLPWQILNFADPSRMEIHDDYYKHYGVEYIQIDSMYAGIASGKNLNGKRIPFGELPLKGWENKVTSHERLKSSYYILKAYWTK